ncbi:tRNA preQ1(34) S-adenosylmethionine ribosyltransferase-isomerase QueA [Limibaculum sp. M0105]|uniref:S-adenosylmethionine:tRNA ribosyltransferase-isomerase n=1 Tax=Thermohalobaculum xanthum TaxID=2753746 RepID=A0A8J7M6Q1_9RHOB|nr:tRNA preQ1(34) S-adenosylmethionine ribosyltransferase-isomerase QueA [Thermohalobaculum xanthum]MBK0399359.1 tRNA preQ1(34) S-adenosylmethionine ribosyltransferase-isomerase QueA [Thermohalobaculum xanthum]
MQLSDFDFELPDALIALRPVRPRPASRLLVAAEGRISDSHVRDLTDWLRPGDLLVFNDTRVIPARLFGERRRETQDGAGVAKIEVTLIHRDGPDLWSALVRPARRLRAGDLIRFGEGLAAEVIRDPGEGETALRFDQAGDALDAAIGRAGVMPLPPYIAQKRPADARDIEDYQTIFARRPGSVAAPTASLHFDEALVERLAASGIGSTRVTLHVGAGTFLPVKVEDISAHRMHAEWGEIGADAAETINATREAGGRVIPVGTTALRLIESAADEDGRIVPWVGETAIFITPGYRFRITDALMTNFHLPKSTLFMLVSALMGLERMQAIYAHAIERGYRFFSYGDSSLLVPERR